MILVFASNSTETTASINGVELDIAYVGTTVILFYVPEGATTGPITVTTPAGSSVSSTDLVIVPPPQIDDFAPEVGVIGEGGSIIGSNFCVNECYTNNSTETTASMNGVELDIVYVGTTVILFYIPEGATTGPITVTTPAGSSVSSTDLVIVPPPQIDDFAPESGAVGIGGSIIGSNFCVNECYTNNSTETTASINGVELDVVFVGTTVILFYIPEGATTGFITVTTPAGSSTTSTELVVTN